MAYSVVFPGQGSQRPQMGLDFVERYPLARRCFEEASEASGIDLLTLCDGDERLNLTEFAQPAILTTEIAIYRVLKSEFGLEVWQWGGHSLGEFSALVAAGAMPFTTAVRLVRRRGCLMQEAAPVGAGQMVAVIQRKTLEIEKLEQIAQQHGVDIANHNSPSQAVLSGELAKVESAVSEARSALARAMFIPLKVSAPFHSRLMRAVETQFREILANEVADCDAEKATTVTSNWLGAFHDGTESGLVDALARQITGTVRWVDNMAMLAKAQHPVLEIGPSKTLRRFFKDSGYATVSVTSVDEADAVLGVSNGDEEG